MAGLLQVAVPKHLGDAVMALPALRALSQGLPGLRMRLVLPVGGGAARTASLRALGEVLDGQGEWDALTARWERVAGGPQSPAVLLAPSLRAAVGARWAGCGVLVGLPGDTRRRFLSHPVPPIQECEPRAALPQRNRSGRRLPALLPREHQADAYVRVAAHALAVLAAESAEAIPALPLPRPAIPRFEPPPRDLAAGRAFWQSAREPEILLHPGVAGVPTKRWPFAHWVALGRSLAAAGRRLAVTAGPGGPEVAEAESLAGTLGVPLAAGGASLPPGAWAAAARLARACVLPDTGLAHLAVAAGAHAVVLFGPSDPRRHAPRGPGRVSVLRSTQDLDCSPCYARRCRNINNHECLRVIEPDAVAASLA